MMNASGGREVQWKIALFLGTTEADYARCKDLSGLGRSFLVR